MARVLRGPRQQPVLLNFGAPIAMAISNIASAASSGPYRGVEVTSPGRILTLSLVSCSSLSQLPATNWRPLLLPLPFGLASGFRPIRLRLTGNAAQSLTSDCQV